MRINEVITESHQLDELSATDIARGVGTAVGKTAHAAGAVAGGLKGAWDAGKAGYEQGLSFTGGQRVGRTAPRASASPNIDSMTDQDLVAMKSKIDSVLAARTSGTAQQPEAGSQAAASAPSKPQRGQLVDINGKKYMYAGQQWVDEKNNIAKGADLQQIKAKFAAGEIPPPSAERPEELGGKPAKQGPIPNSGEILKALAKLKPDQIEAIRGMLTSKVQGQQNVAEGIGSAIKGAWNKLTGRGGLSFDAIKQAIDQMSPEDAQALLNQFPAAPAAQPSGKGLPGLTAPTLTPKPSGNVTAGTGAPSKPGSITTGGISKPGVAAPAASTAAQPAAAPTAPKKRAPVGMDPNAPPEKRLAKRTTDYGWYEKGGINPSTPLSAADPASFAAAQAKKKQATAESFHSKFLGKDI